MNEAVQLDKQKRVTWVRGDMREVPLGRQFDAVVNLFTSFGYFDEEEQNARVFYEMNRLLKEGGRFIIDFLNPIYVQAHLVPQSQRMEEIFKFSKRESLKMAVCVSKL